MSRCGLGHVAAGPRPRGSSPGDSGPLPHARARYPAGPERGRSRERAGVGGVGGCAPAKVAAVSGGRREAGTEVWECRPEK